MQIASGLCNLNRTADGQSVAYLNLSLLGLCMLTAESLKTYSHLQVLSLQDNMIHDVSDLGYLRHLTDLNLSKNNLTEVRAQILPSAWRTLWRVQSCTDAFFSEECAEMISMARLHQEYVCMCFLLKLGTQDISTSSESPKGGFVLQQDWQISGSWQVFPARTSHSWQEQNPHSTRYKPATVSNSPEPKGEQIELLLWIGKNASLEKFTPRW